VQILEIFLGILTAMGGFVEVGELTFMLNAGSKFDYRLLWVVALGTIGIMVYGEIAGRIAAVRGQPVFNVVRERAGIRLGLLTLVSATLVCLLTCAAEIGGIALLWQLMSGLPYRLLIALALAFLLVVVWCLPFKWIERVFGLFGLFMVVFMVVVWMAHPDWGAVAAGFVPTLPEGPTDQRLLQSYYAVALLSSVMLPYETYFYASGGIEDKWKAKDVPMNRVIVIIGFLLGGALAGSIMIVGKSLLGPLQIEAQLPGTAAIVVAMKIGRVGMWCALTGMFFAFAGAAIETALSCAYNIAQFFGWPYGKKRAPRTASRFALTWIAAFVLAALIVLTGVDPIRVVEYSIVFSVVILPLTYFPLMALSRDREVMGEHVNGVLANTLGWFYFVLVCIVAAAAIPLLILTHGGEG